jgi:heat shock protein 4
LPGKFEVKSHGRNVKSTRVILLLQADGMRKDRVTTRLEIPVSENIYGGMTRAELSEAQQKEIQLAQQDRTMEQTKDKKNALESYVYEMRNKVWHL